MAGDRHVAMRQNRERSCAADRDVLYLQRSDGDRQDLDRSSCAARPFDGSRSAQRSPDTAQPKVQVSVVDDVPSSEQRVATPSVQTWLAGSQTRVASGGRSLFGGAGN
jgi:hypothetical protein